MAGATTNWLTFSLTSMDSLKSPDSRFGPYDNNNTSSHCFFDNFYANNNGWANSKGLMDSQSENRQLVVPKMEDFFENQTETKPRKDSSLTQIYEHGSGSGLVYFGDLQDLNAIPGFQPFSGTNSGSKLDDSASDKTRVAPTVLGAGACQGTLSLGDVALGSNDKAIVSAAEFDTHKKAAHGFGQRTSVYRGVTRHRWTGRYEAHLWDNSCRREGQARKGRQVYLGGYDKEEKAARAYDLAALKYWGPAATTNFPVSNYTTEIEEMQHAGKQEFIASLRRKSSGFSRGASAFRGVTRHHQQGRWQARIGRVAGNKDLYLGTFTTEEEAAEAYDIAAIKFRGAGAVTNFEMSRYDVKSILNNTLPVGGATKRLKLSPEPENKAPAASTQQPQSSNVGSSINFSAFQPVAAAPYDSANPCYPRNMFLHFHPTNGEGGSSTSESSATATNATSIATLPPPPPPPPPPVPGFFLWPCQPY